MSGTPNGPRRPLVVGNWKMHLTHLEAIAHAQKIAYTLKPTELDAVETVVLPAFTSLRSVQTLIDGEHLGVGYGAQDLAVDAAGAHTGDVSGPMLAALGCRYVIVGHSERRVDHGETDQLVAAKLRAAYSFELTPILCVGENLDIRERGDHLAFVTAQLASATADLAEPQATTLVVAYEPIWAIGTGRTATPADAQEMCAALRGHLAGQFGPAAAGIRLLYGGSVKAGNAAALFVEQDVDGALVGGASLAADEFAAIARAAVRQP